MISGAVSFLGVSSLRELIVNVFTLTWQAHYRRGRLTPETRRPLHMLSSPLACYHCTYAEVREMLIRWALQHGLRAITLALRDRAYQARGRHACPHCDLHTFSQQGLLSWQHHFCVRNFCTRTTVVWPRSCGRNTTRHPKSSTHVCLSVDCVWDTWWRQAWQRGAMWPSLNSGNAHARIHMNVAALLVKLATV